MDENDDLYENNHENSEYKSSVPEPPDSDEYNFNNKRRGLALIVVNEKDSTGELRPGCEKDITLLQEMFSKLGFDVRTYRNCNKRGLIKILKEAQEEDFSESDCFAMAISSHGDESEEDNVREDVILTTDEHIKTREILEYFTDEKCPSLKDKPRLFFIQSCRGDKLDPGQDLKVVKGNRDQKKTKGSNCDQVDAVPKGPGYTREAWGAGTQPHQYQSENIAVASINMPAEKLGQRFGGMPFTYNNPPVIPAPCYPDFLLMYATPPGFYAFRRPATGSWFISKLSEVLKNSNGVRRLFNELTTVSGLVARDMASKSKDPELDKKKQVPVIYSMLTKDVMFRPK